MLELLAATAKAMVSTAMLGGAGIVLGCSTLGIARPDSQIRLAGILLAASALAAACLLFIRLGAGWDVAMLGAVLHSSLGAALLLQVVAGVCLAASRRGPALMGALLAPLSVAIAGHSASHSAWAASAVGLHVAAAAWWVGGVWLLLMASRQLAPAAFLLVLRRFSSQALGVVATLLLAGTLTLFLLLGRLPDVSHTYDRALLLKLALVLALLGLAAVNRWQLTPALARDAAALPRLRLALQVELSLFVGVLLWTAWLTTTLSPH